MTSREKTPGWFNSGTSLGDNSTGIEAVGEDGQPIRVNGQPLMVSPDSFLDRVDRLRENPTYSFDSRGRIVENGTEGSLRLPFNVGTTLRQLGQTDTGHTIQREGLDVQRDSNAAQIGLGYAQLRSQERRDAAQLRLQQIVANRSPQVSPSDFMAINAAIDAGVITPEAASAQFNIPLENLQRASRHMYIPPTGGTGTGDPLDNAFGYVRAHGGRFNWRNILPGGKPFFESEEHLSDRDVVEAQQRRYEGVVAALINVETNPVAYRQVLQAQNSTLEAALAGAQNALLRPGLTVEQQADMRRIANYTSALLGRQPPPMMP